VVDLRRDFPIRSQVQYWQSSDNKVYIIPRPLSVERWLRMYTDKVMDHFMNPKNMGEMKDADGIGKVGNPVCGDLMWVFIKVKDDILVDVKFKTFGCGAAIATSSMVTTLAIGKTLDEGLKITRADVAKELGGLPAIKMHCSNLAADALHAAIKDYLIKQGRDASHIKVEEEAACPIDHHPPQTR